jgi:hypothetical protein
MYCRPDVHFIVFYLHTEGRSSIRNLRTRHAVVTGTHLSRGLGTVTETRYTMHREPVWYAK